jgi:hypothetical protein
MISASFFASYKEVQGPTLAPGFNPTVSTMKNHLRKFYVCGLVGTIAFAGVAHAGPQFVNGSFEADPFSPGGQLDLGALGGPLTGWTVLNSPDNVYPWGLPNGNTYNAGPTPYGNQWVIVGDYGMGGSWIEQTVSGFTVGDKYTLSFALASEYDGAGGVGSLVDVNIMGLLDNTFEAPLRGPNYWDTWGTFTEGFVANDTSLTIRFTGLAGSGFDPGIDNVQILSPSGVPDGASSLALLGMGLLAIGGFSIHRNRQRCAA